MSSGFYSQIINAPKRPKRAFGGRFGGVLGRFGRFVAFFGCFVAFFGRFVAFDAGPKKHHLFFDLTTLKFTVSGQFHMKISP